MSIRSHWDELDAGTQKWLMDHPGCLIVPRSLAAAMNNATAESVVTDQHGQILLTGDDVEFIRARSHTALSVEGAKHFFDAVQPRHADRDTSDGHGPDHPRSSLAKETSEIRG